MILNKFGMIKFNNAILNFNFNFNFNFKFDVMEQLIIN
jgi:hypothetical protein